MMAAERGEFQLNPAITGEGIDDAGFDELEAALVSAPAHVDYDEPYADNLARAAYAAEGLIAYAKRVRRYGNESIATVLRDMLNDARHLCDLAGLDWDTVSEPIHYNAEIEGDL